MSRLAILTAVVLIATIASVLADEQVWQLDNWPADAVKIPCSAWSKAADGTWVLTGGAVKLGSETLSNVGVKKSDAAARLLDRECGAK